MDYQQRNPLTIQEKEFYANLVQLCPPGVVVLSKIKLAELVKPTAESGSDKFYNDIKKILSVTLDFVVYDLNNNYTVAVFDYQGNGIFKEERKSFLSEVFKQSSIEYFCISRVAELYLIDFFKG
ncbi:TPA: DUF2726 domain-containing protein [Yersinia enterocolitica]|uniref:DUF2726 domain-containing protein n=1 Tax=Serratia liquefaciens TaxID=614 RepID=UPI002177DE33|nr:DUF2726 domain-containing protein [Serratia liquefaciens]EMA9490308.1 DUF2726 domain-containing protein [Yersinia enterocolitica]CAI1196542.1 Protein of uncharacterised function (DUF2726) [Serratia liquefaciens]HEN3585246.1 DUF2726 domain-containing protein [Yersinia enterocolitica]